MLIIGDVFQSRVFYTATTQEEEVVKSKGIIPGVAVDYPSHEIPEWFNYQSEGSSITINLPPDWYIPKTFLGFVVSVKGNCYGGFGCTLYLKTEHSENLEVDLSFSVGGLAESSSLDHVFMWYNCVDHSKANFRVYQEAKFEFFSYVYGEKVKRCGVRMLHLKDAVNDRPPIIKKVKKVIENEAEGRKREHQEVITWIKKVVGSSIMESDSEEPPPTGTRNLLQSGARMLNIEDAVKLIIGNEAEERKCAKLADLEYQSPGSEIIESDSEPPPKQTQNLWQGSPSGKEI